MSASIEAELRLLVRQVSKRATLGGGMDRLTYDALTAASVALAGKALVGESLSRKEALCAAQVRLRACEAQSYVEAA